MSLTSSQDAALEMIWGILQRRGSPPLEGEYQWFALYKSWSRIDLVTWFDVPPRRGERNRLLSATEEKYIRNVVNL